MTTTAAPFPVGVTVEQHAPWQSVVLHLAPSVVTTVASFVLAWLTAPLGLAAVALGGGW
jgi:hypothetical protein